MMRRLVFFLPLLWLAGAGMAEAAGPAAGYDLPGGQGRVTSFACLTPDSNGNLTVGCGPGGSSAAPSYTKPSPLTIVPFDVASVSTANTAVTALAAGHATAGGFIVTSNAAGVCVNQNGTAGTATSGSTICAVANQQITLVPSGNAVSVNSTASNVVLGGEGLQ